jgi:hypothetical protein
VAQPLPGPLPPLAHCRAEVSSAPTAQTDRHGPLVFITSGPRRCWMRPGLVTPARGEGDADDDRCRGYPAACSCLAGSRSCDLENPPLTLPRCRAPGVVQILRLPCEKSQRRRRAWTMRKLRGITAFGAVVPIDGDFKMRASNETLTSLLCTAPLECEANALSCGRRSCRVRGRPHLRGPQRPPVGAEMI